MRDLPDELETDVVADALAEGWGFEADTIEYAAVGAGSYHWFATDGAGTRRFVTVDDLDQKSWLGETRDVVCDALRRAFDTAVALRSTGLDFVVAPIPTSCGESLSRIGQRHTVGLFPFVDGHAGDYGHYEPGARAAVAAILADLHSATPAVVANSVGLELPGRRQVEASLRELNETWSGGPLSEPARQVLAAHAADIAGFLSVAGTVSPPKSPGEAARG